MAPDILAKLQRQLGLDTVTESGVVYMLVETRKYIETQADDFQARYELLKMYCDWAVHIELHSNRHLIEMLKTFDEDVSGSSIDTRAFLKYSTLTEFKEEFGGSYARSVCRTSPQTFQSGDGFYGTIPKSWPNAHSIRIERAHDYRTLGRSACRRNQIFQGSRKESQHCIEAS
jgi:hypothetical protein